MLRKSSENFHKIWQWTFSETEFLTKLARNGVWNLARNANSDPMVEKSSKSDKWRRKIWTCVKIRKICKFPYFWRDNTCWWQKCFAPKHSFGAKKHFGVKQLLGAKNPSAPKSVFALEKKLSALNRFLRPRSVSSNFWSKWADFQRRRPARRWKLAHLPSFTSEIPPKFRNFCFLEVVPRCVIRS